MDLIPIERLLDKINICHEYNCWLWIGAKTNKGYGQIRFQGKLYAAHRVMYEKLKSRIPANLDIDHLCRIRHCVNPDHLEPVTRRENITRGMVGENMRCKTHCPLGHPLSGDNVYLDPRNHRGCRQCRELARVKNRAKNGKL